MGRRSLADERTDQILDAVEACVSRDGLRGMTIASIARAAGMSPGHVTHYLPTKRAILGAAIERITERLDLRQDTEFAGLGPREQLDRRIDRSFSGRYDELQRLLAELLVVAQTDESTRSLLASVYRHYQALWEDTFAAAFPDAPAAQRREVARTVLWMSVGSLAPRVLEIDPRASAALRRSARLLVASLEDG